MGGSPLEGEMFCFERVRLSSCKTKCCLYCDTQRCLSSKILNEDIYDEDIFPRAHSTHSKSVPPPATFITMSDESLCVQCSVLTQYFLTFRLPPIIPLTFVFQENSAGSPISVVSRVFHGTVSMSRDFVLFVVSA